MRKIINAGLAVGIFFTLYNVVQFNLPEWTANLILSRLEQTGFEEVFQHEGLDLPPNQELLLQKALATVTHEIIGSRIEGERAYVAVDLTFMDLQQLVEENIGQLLNNAMGNLSTLLSGLIGGEVIDTALGELLTLLEDPSLHIPLKTRQVEVVLKRQFLWWVPEMEENISRFEALIAQELQVDFLQLLRGF